MKIVITGANRGIGLELARQYLARGDSVVAAVRDPTEATRLAALGEGGGGRLRVAACDVTLDGSVRAFAAGLSEPVDLLINNAGIKTERDELADLDLGNAARTFQVNVLGVLRITLALLPLLRRAPAAKIASISSGLGSIERNLTGGIYGYRISKAALNMASRSLAQDLRKDRIIAVALTPGWVKTDMGGAGAPTEVSDSAAGLIRVIDGLKPEDSGKCISFLGENVPW
jgi:NAD(P)-dependent dehydrogenase (short-subunit alcohol dehydrogenase family)